MLHVCTHTAAIRKKHICIVLLQYRGNKKKNQNFIAQAAQNTVLEIGFNVFSFHIFCVCLRETPNNLFGFIFVQI